MGDLAYPASPAELTPDWYTTALRSTGTIADGTSVTAASAEPIGVGVGILSLLWRVRLTYEGGEGPATAVLKLPHTVAGARQTADAFSFYGREVNFYREVGHRTPLGNPTLYASNYDPETKDFMLLLEDVGARKQYDQLDGCPVEDALIAAKELASHHAWYWQDQGIIDADWTFRTCDPPNPQALPPTLRESWPLIEGEFAHLLPGPMLDAARRMPDACVELLERLSEPPLTLLHGDYRLDNLFFDPGAEDPVAAIDWQICGLGRAPYDIAYFMSQSLTPRTARPPTSRSCAPTTRGSGPAASRTTATSSAGRTTASASSSAPATPSTPAPSTWSTTGQGPSSKPCSPAPSPPSPTWTP